MTHFEINARMSGAMKMKLTPPESEPDAAVPVIIEEENATKPRKSSMHHSSPSSAGPVTDKLVTPAQAAFRKRSVTFNPMSSFEVHEEKAEDDADGGDEAEKEGEKSNKLSKIFHFYLLHGI